MLFQYVVHPRGLDPFQAAKAWHLRVQGGLPWKAVRAQVHTVSGAQPGQDAIEDAVARVGAQRHARCFQKSGAVQSKYHRCGRAPLLTRAQKQAVVAFVKRWRSRRFCTANYIIQELKLQCKKKTVHRTLNEAGFHWRPVAKKGKLSGAQLAQRKVFVRRGASLQELFDAGAIRLSVEWLKKHLNSGGKLGQSSGGSRGFRGFPVVSGGFRVVRACTTNAAL